MRGRSSCATSSSRRAGYWNGFWDGLLDLDEDFFEAYAALLVGPVETGPLDPKIKEFVYIAVDAAATHLYVPGIRQHIKQALGHGATARRSWRCSS